MNELIIPINPSLKIPVYEQIYHYIKEEIKRESLPCHGRLPSTRSLARHMQISRGTVDMAYAQLVAEGYVEAVPCKGYFVAKIEGLYMKKQDSIFPKAKEREEKKRYPYDFSPNGIDLENFPFHTWKKITKNILSDERRNLFGSGIHKGDENLREAICDYLHQARGVNLTPDQMIIGAGNEYLLMLLHLIIGTKAVIAMENPTYKQAYRVFQSLGHEVKPISMDTDGLMVSELKKSGANIAYVMPSHQYPLGIVMPLKRRLELLSWANTSFERYIIEDDHDSELRYKGKPIPALQGFDTEGKVIYLGTFSKAITPAIRISYMVLPKDLCERYEEQYSFYSSTVSRVDQAVIEAFLREGYFERHLNRMRSIYRNKHDLMMSELKKFSGFQISGENAGIHLLLTTKKQGKEEELIESAASKGVRVYGLSEYYIVEEEKERKATVILGYANQKEGEILEGIALLKEAWKQYNL